MCLGGYAENRTEAEPFPSAVGSAGLTVERDALRGSQDTHAHSNILVSWMTSSSHSRERATSLTLTAHPTHPLHSHAQASTAGASLAYGEWGTAACPFHGRPGSKGHWEEAVRVTDWEGAHEDAAKAYAPAMALQPSPTWSREAGAATATACAATATADEAPARRTGSAAAPPARRRATSAPSRAHTRGNSCPEQAHRLETRGDARGLGTAGREAGWR